MTPDYEKLYRQYIKGVKQVGNDPNQFQGLCQFHDDHYPSFSINLETGCYYCHSCGAKGNAYQFAEKVGYGNPNEFIDNNAQVKKNSEQMDLPLIGSDELLKKAEKYHKNLSQDEIEDQPIKIELIVGRDAQGRYTFPYHDMDGNIIGIKHHKGKNGESPYWEGDGACKWYGMYLFKNYDKSKPLYNCEGENDCLMLLTLGHQAICGSAGAGSIPKDLSQIDGFAEYIIIYDNDSAGKKGAEKLAERLGVEL